MEIDAPSPPIVANVANTESATCTICGLKCDDRSAFNAHIRAHLKDKLTNRRKLQQQQQQQHNITTSAGSSSGTTSSVTSTASTSAATSISYPRDTVKRAKVILPTVASTIVSTPTPPTGHLLKPPVIKVEKTNTMTNIQNLLPSSPLPMTNAVSCVVKAEKQPDLEALLSQLRQQKQPQQASDPLVMAELAACKPIPPAISNKTLRPVPTTTLSSATTVITTESSRPLPPAPAAASTKTKVTSSIPAMPCTPEISDMEDDLMSYEMEMNRIDFHNDLAYLLDQIEKDFESPCIGHDFRLDTPPDSDCETTDSFGRLLNQMSSPPTTLALSPAAATAARMTTLTTSLPRPQDSHDLLGLDRFSQRIDESSLSPISSASSATAPGSHPLLNSQGSDIIEDTIKLIQSPASVAKVGKLPAKTLAVLNKLPARLFGLPNQQLSSSISMSNSPNLNNLLTGANTGGGEQRFVDVVKVENSTNIQMTKTHGPAGQLLTAPGTQCIINIECRNPNEPSKIIQSFRAIDTGTEIKLVPADLSFNNVVSKHHMPAVIAVPPPPALATSASALQPAAVAVVTDPMQFTENGGGGGSGGKVKTGTTSHCPICNKCITNKNMARHLEKHRNAEMHQETHNNNSGGNEKKFVCKYCFKSFSQRSHLSRHAKCHNSAATNNSNISNNNSQLACRICGKLCKNRMSLDRHRAKHLACIHCSALFENKITLQDHLLKAHPEKAIVSLVQPPEYQPSSDGGARLDLDDLGSIGSNTASHSVDYSFSPQQEQPIIGDSLADIADSNYFYCGSSDITDDLYSTDLFSTSATAQTC